MNSRTSCFEETRAFFELLYNNLVMEVEKVNTVNRKMKETNAELTIELARYKGQEKCFEINQEKYDKLEDVIKVGLSRTMSYKKIFYPGNPLYQKKCLTKKINALHLSSAKTIKTLNEEIANLNNQLSKEKSTVSFLQQERKKLKNDFKTWEDELLDKLIESEKKNKELDNILVKTGQSIQTMHMLSPKPDSFYHTKHKMAIGYENPHYLKKAQKKQQSLYNGKVLLEKHDPPDVYDSEETLQLAQESHLKMKQLNKEIKPANYAKINQLSKVFVSQKAKSREELYFSNTFKTASVSNTVSKPILIPNEEFSNNASSPSIAWKFLNEVQKILKDEIAPIVNHVDARVQNFEIQFLKETAKFVRDFKCLAKEADESLDRIKRLENENERLLRAVTRAQTKLITDSLQEKLNDTIYKNATLRAQLLTKFYEQQNEVKGTSANTRFSKPSILEKPPFQFLRNQSVVRQPTAFQSEWPKFPKNQFIPKVDVNNDLTKPVTSHSVQKAQELKVVNNDKVIAPGMSRINLLKNSRVDNFVPNKHVKASVRTKSITVSQPHVIIKKDVNSNTNGLSSTTVENTTKTSKPQTRSNLKNDRIPSASTNSCLSNNLKTVEEHHRNLSSLKILNHRSFECINIKLVTRNDKSEVICATCKQCLITANHDECVFKYVNSMNSSKKNQSANVSENANQKKHKPNVKKSKKLGSEERLVSPRPNKPRIFLSQNWRDLPRDTPIDRVEVLRESNTLSWKSCQGDSLNLPDHRYNIYTVKWRTGLVDGVTIAFQLSHCQGHMLILKDQGYTQGINQDLKKALNIKDTLSQALISKNFRKEHQVDDYKEIKPQVYLKAKDHDIKIKVKDIKIKIEIQDHKHAKGTAKEFPRIQGSKIQDVIRSEAICAMTTL
ncbi:hypothetical protein Tco_0537739 [Tanacetum coccineum]